MVKRNAGATPGVLVAELLEVEELTGKAISEAGFHPKRHEKVFLVQFEQWPEPIAVSATNLIIISDREEKSA